MSKITTNVSVVCKHGNNAGNWLYIIIIIYNDMEC